MKKTKADKAFDKMATALAEYIESLGGKALVLGGTGVWQEPGDGKYNYWIRFKVTGKMPKERK